MKSSENNLIITRNDKALSKSGYLFYLDDISWTLDKNTTIPIESLIGLLNIESENSFLKTLSFYATNHSASHTQNIFYRCLHFLRASGKDVQITEPLLINYRSTLTSDTEWYLGTIRGFLKKWYNLGYPGISDDVIELLDGWIIKGNIKGDVVKRLDPISGPLSDIELQAFNECAVQAYESNTITLTELSMGLSISNTGRRPIQISHLRIKDILKGTNKKGEQMYFLNVPRAKQQGVTFRGEFKQFAITKELWVILNAQANHSTQLVETVIGFELQDYDRLELPIFPDIKVFSRIESPKKLREYLKNDRLHIKSEIVTQTCKNIAKAAEIHSERTKGILHINSNRFRYTIGTRAAREGFGELVIAELLDHSDTQNAGVYIKNIPEHVKKLDQAVGRYLAPYAQAFAGILVDTESDAQRGNDLNPSSQLLVVYLL